MIIFKYRQEKTPKGIVFRPVALIEFESLAHGFIPAELYIDSGADVTLIPQSFGELLGFKLKHGEKAEQVGGIGGKIPIVYRNVRIRIQNNVFKITAAWATTEQVPPLLGRKDIFDLYHVTFKQNLQIVIFEAVGKK